MNHMINKFEIISNIINNYQLWMFHKINHIFIKIYKYKIILFYHRVKTSPAIPFTIRKTLYPKLYTRRVAVFLIVMIF